MKRIITGLLFFVLVCIPNTSKADTLADIQSMLRTLISELNAKISSGAFYSIKNQASVGYVLSDTSFSPSVCPSNKDLSSHIGSEVDGRINGVSGSASTKSLWQSRGNDVGGWVRNQNVWTNNGGAIDWTGLSPWNDGYYVHGGTLITPRNIVYASHYKIGVGKKVVFVDSQNNVVVRTLVASQNAGDDIEVGLLDSDVPSNIVYYPIVSASEFDSRLGTKIDLPLVLFNKNDNVLIADISMWSSKQIGHNKPTSSKRAEFAETLITGDSGRAGFVIIDGKPVLVLTHHFSTSGPDYSNFYNEINSTLDSLGGGYHITTYNLDCFDLTPYTLKTSLVGTGLGKISGQTRSIQKYAENKTVTLEASANPDSTFVGWEGDCSGTASCIITMNSDKNVSANFIRNPPKITSPSNNQILTETTSVTITWEGNSTNYVTEIQDTTASSSVIQNRFQKGNSAQFTVIPGHNYVFKIASGQLVTKQSAKSEVSFSIGKAGTVIAQPEVEKITPVQVIPEVKIVEKVEEEVVEEEVEDLPIVDDILPPPPAPIVPDVATTTIDKAVLRKELVKQLVSLMKELVKQLITELNQKLTASA